MTLQQALPLVGGEDDDEFVAVPALYNVAVGRGFRDVALAGKDVQQHRPLSIPAGQVVRAARRTGVRPCTCR